jgi:hypothetical protein
LHWLTLNEGLVAIDRDSFAGLTLEVLALSGTCAIVGFHFAKCKIRSLFTPRNGPQVSRGDVLMEGRRLVRWLGIGEMAMIPGDVESLGAGCFVEDSIVREVAFSDESGLIEICEAAFQLSQIERITIPKSVCIIEKAAFTRCTALVEVRFELPASLKRIGELAFLGAALHSVVIPQSVEVMGDRAFASCGKLGEVVFEGDSQMRVLGARAFTRSRLKEITIPASVEVIGDQCFYECFWLAKVEFSE